MRDAFVRLSKCVSSVRDYLHVMDLAEGHVAALKFMVCFLSFTDEILLYILLLHYMQYFLKFLVA